MKKCPMATTSYCFQQECIQLGFRGQKWVVELTYYEVRCSNPPRIKFFEKLPQMDVSKVSVPLRKIDGQYFKVEDLFLEFSMWEHLFLTLIMLMLANIIWNSCWDNKHWIVFNITFPLWVIENFFPFKIGLFFSIISLRAAKKNISECIIWRTINNNSSPSRNTQKE